MPQLPILILGGTGKTGQRVDALLNALGMTTRPVSRSTTPAFDWSDPQTWASVFDGVSSAYVTFQPDLAVEGAAAAIAEVSRLARERNLERVVLLSGRGEPGAEAAEAALQASGNVWTIVRSSWFNQNFSEGFLLDAILAGEVALPAGTVAEPFLDIDDLSEVVAVALTDDRHANRIYEVTGPRLLTFADAVSAIAEAVAKPIAYRQISPSEFEERLRPHAPDVIVSLMTKLFTVGLDGRNARVTFGIEEALDRPPRDFSDYVRRTAASGVWGN